MVPLPPKREDRLPMTTVPDDRRATTPTAPPTTHQATYVDTHRRDAAQIARGAGLRSTVPPSGDITALDALPVLPEITFFERLDGVTRRIEMLTAVVRADGLSRVQCSRAIQSTLGSIAVSAEEARVAPLSALARVLQAAVAELVDDAGVDSAGTLDVVLFDPWEVSRDFVAVAVEAQGHLVRSANSYDDFVNLLSERLPDVVISEVMQQEGAATRPFCSVLRELLGGRPVQLILISTLPPEELDDLRRLANADSTLSKQLGLPALVSDLSRIFQKMNPLSGGRAPPPQSR